MSAMLSSQTRDPVTAAVVDRMRKVSFCLLPPMIHFASSNYTTPYEELHKHIRSGVITESSTWFLD